MTLRVYTIVNFKGHWPVGTAAIVVAKNETRARELFSRKLREHKLPEDSSYTLSSVPLDKEAAIILIDGNY